MKERFQQVNDFLKHEIWRIRLAALPPKKSFLIKHMRILILSVREFGRDKCQLRASALTFYSLTSVVPVIAMIFGIAKGFGFDKVLEVQLRNKFTGQEEIVDKIVGFSHAMLANTKGGLIAGVGLIVLFWAVIKMLGQIEDSMSDIWKLKEQRSLGRKFSDYLSFMLICPVLIILSGSATVFITTQVTLILDKIDFLGVLSPVVLFVLRLLPLALVWTVFTFIYIFMPNTKVRFSAGLLAGVVAGTIFQIVEWIYITFQIGVANYNAIYGSFAALPLFLVWLQTSWLIVLYGVELSYACQKVDDFEFEPDASQTSHYFRMLLSLRIMQYLVSSFVKKETPPTADGISQDLEIPKCLVNAITSDLLESRLLSSTESGGASGFQPAQDINILTVQYVIDALERKGINKLPFAETPDFDAIVEPVQSFRNTIEKLPANKLLKDL
jgi:membrane protein